MRRTSCWPSARREFVVTARAIVQTADQDAAAGFLSRGAGRRASLGRAIVELIRLAQRSGGRLEPTAGDVCSQCGRADWAGLYAGTCGRRVGLWIVRREIPPLLALAFVAAGFIIARKLYVSRRLLLPPVAALFAASAALLMARLDRHGLGFVALRRGGGRHGLRRPASSLSPARSRTLASPHRSAAASRRRRAARRRNRPRRRRASSPFALQCLRKPPRMFRPPIALERPKRRRRWFHSGRRRR